MLLINVGFVRLHTGHVRGSESALAQLLGEESSFHLSNYARGCQGQALPCVVWAHAHSYTVEWSKRPVKEMHWVKTLLCQQRNFPLLLACQCMHIASCLASEMILTTMHDQVAFKSHPPAQMMTKLQGFQELSAALTSTM